MRYGLSYLFIIDPLKILTLKIYEILTLKIYVGIAVVLTQVADRIQVVVVNKTVTSNTRALHMES